jgi:hypothetical protein
MSYLSGRGETNSRASDGMGGLGWPDLLNPSTWYQGATKVAAAVTPAGMMWLAPPDVQKRAAQQTTPLGKQTIMQVGQAQSLLMQLGLYPGPVIGTMDGNTQQALDSFRAAVGLPRGGAVSEMDLGALNQAVTSHAAQTGIQLPGANILPQAPGFFSSLPPWALPVGALGIGLLAIKLLK